MSADSPFLRYETAEVNGISEPVYYHSDHDETIVGTELGEVDDPDEWAMRWFCPACGVRDPAEDELKPAGWTSIHLPCATEAEIEQAAVEEARVSANIRNAKAFEAGVYDPTGEGDR